jgi:hypothetical protein
MSGAIGVTSQSDPNASVAPASSSERNAYVVRARAAVVRLHRGNHVVARKLRNVAGNQVLRVLDAQAAVAFAMLAFQALVEAENGVVGLIADGMNRNLQAGGVGMLDIAPHPLQV